MNLLDDAETQKVWQKIDETFSFRPSMTCIPFQIAQNHKIFSLLSYWNNNQEAVVNCIFSSISNEEIYALDWQHDCFHYAPSENIPLDLSWHDDVRNCQVYFLSYYPDGDYHFFISRDFSYGMMGHPWRKEIWVFGQNLIEKFKGSEVTLNLQEKILL